MRKVGFLFLFFGMSATAQDAMRWIRQGDSLDQALDAQGAYEAYQRAAEGDSTNNLARVKIAEKIIQFANEIPRSAEQRKKYRDAESLIRRSIKEDSSNIFAYYVLFEIFDKQAAEESGSARRAIFSEWKKLNDRILALDTLQNQTYRWLGIWHREVYGVSWVTKTWSRIWSDGYQNASLENSVDLLRKAASLDSFSCGNLVEMGKTLTLMEQWAAADSVFLKAVSVPVRSKRDHKIQRDARHWRELLSEKRYSELELAIE